MKDEHEASWAAEEFAEINLGSAGNCERWKGGAKPLAIGDSEPRNDQRLHLVLGEVQWSCTGNLLPDRLDTGYLCARKW